MAMTELKAAAYRRRHQKAVVEREPSQLKAAHPNGFMASGTRTRSADASHTTTMRTGMQFYGTALDPCWNQTRTCYFECLANAPLASAQ